MTDMLKKFAFLAYFGVALFLVNCKGDDGAVGPAGQAGAKGDAGATGPAGPKGDTGVSGAARYYSLGADSTDDKGYLYANFEATTAADEAFWENAAAMVFVKANGVYWALPGTVVFPGNMESTFAYYHGYAEKVFYAEILQKDWTGKSAENSAPPMRKVEDIRIIAIPTSAARLNGSVDWNNLEAAKAALGLTESDLKSL
jgi:hypothetical protein